MYTCSQPSRLFTLNKIVIAASFLIYSLMPNMVVAAGGIAKQKPWVCSVFPAL